jgi:aminopeptidase N
LFLILGILSLVLPGRAFSQIDSTYQNFIDHKVRQNGMDIALAQESYYINDTTIDVLHYDLSLMPSLDENYLSGEVKIRMRSTVDSLKDFLLDLAPELSVVDFSPPIQSVIQGGRKLKIVLEEYQLKGDWFEFFLEFEGYPTLLNNTKGLHYRLSDPENPLIVSLSTPYLAHQWWPCKDGPEDKADGARITICIPKETPGGKKLMAVSNGLLVEEDLEDDEYSCFVWAHNYPIVPYYIMMAVAPYSTINQKYQSAHGMDFPLEYFVFEEHKEAAQAGVAALPEVMDFFERTFGPYPFNEEKYGMTQLGFYGGIENQTNSIVNRMSSDYFMVSVHELAHMWFGDMITCADWHEGWLNEGFATYAECLWMEYSLGKEAYLNRLKSIKYTQGGTIYLEDDKDPFGIFTAIIYYKGAWLLHMLRGIMGDEMFFNALKNYALDDRWAYGNATTQDLISVCEEEYGHSLQYFFDQWLYEPYYPDYHYRFEQKQDLSIHLALHQKQKDTYPSAPYFRMPMTVRLIFENDMDSLVQIPTAAVERKSYTIATDRIIKNLEIDPDDWILCEKQLDPTVQSKELKLSDKAYLFPSPFRLDDQVHLISPSPMTSLEIFNEKQISLQKISLNKVQKYSLEPGNLLSGPGIYFFTIVDIHHQKHTLKAICMPR